jgi:hypothetical protein
MSRVSFQSALYHHNHHLRVEMMIELVLAVLLLKTTFTLIPSRVVQSCMACRGYLTWSFLALLHKITFTLIPSVIRAESCMARVYLTWILPTLLPKIALTLIPSHASRSIVYDMLGIFDLVSASPPSQDCIYFDTISCEPFSHVRHVVDTWVGPYQPSFPRSH